MAITDHLDQIEPTALAGAGLALFLVPEPASSAAGLGLMLLAGAWWVKEWDPDGVPGR